MKYLLSNTFKMGIEREQIKKSLKYFSTGTAGKS